MDVQNIPLATGSDSRGTLTEIFRQEWFDGPSPVQWNLVQSNANVMRGVHVHVTHVDYLVVLSGQMQIGLCDLRGNSGHNRAGWINTLSEENRSVLAIPPGVAHGFYFAEPTTFVYGVSSYWDPVHDEFGCRWDDPALGIPWPHITSPALSERDENADSLAAMMQELHNDGKTPW